MWWKKRAGTWMVLRRKKLARGDLLLSLNEEKFAARMYTEDNFGMTF